MEGYHSTQGAEVLVPQSGLVGPHHEYTFQTPRTITFKMLSAILPTKIDPLACHIVTTVAAFNKTLEDDPQGEPGATVSLYNSKHGRLSQKPFYYEIFHGKTNPFARGLNATTQDGGLVFLNVPPQTEPYTLVATKPGFRLIQQRDREL